MEALFTPIEPAYTDREVRIDYKGTDFPVYRRGGAEDLRVRRAYITFREVYDQGPQETWVVKRIKLIAPERIFPLNTEQPSPVVITDLEGCSEYASSHSVPWWLMKAVVQGLGFVR